MKPYVAIGAAAAVIIAGAAGLWFSPDAVRQRTENQNRQIVTDFYDMAFNKHQPREAAQRYIGAVYIQHNPHVPNGAAPFYEYFEPYFAANPGSRAIIHRAVADGDLVALHVESKQLPADPGQAVVDIFRVENGKIVEHFDVIQPVVVDTANGNTMFSGDKAD